MARLIIGIVVTSLYSAVLMAGGTHAEHMAVLSLLTPDQASHIAVNSQDWSNPSTWSSGSVPGTGADVYIPEDISVSYDANSNSKLDVVRIDGTLSFDRSVNTKIVLQTMITGMKSSLKIGTVNQPIGGNVKSEIIFIDDAIDKNIDPSQMGHGLVAIGQVDIHGAAKLPYSTLGAPALRGMSSIRLNGDLSTWRVGDDILIVGTNGDTKAEDEIRRIVQISDNGTVSLDSPLDYDHRPPQGYDDLPLYVANTSRNIEFRSENVNGIRGHTMFMNESTDIRFAEFLGLGRTDKGIPLDADGNALDGSDNITGRYSIHFHEIGVGDDYPLAIAYGNSVHDNPGWGITHHSSNAAIDFNVVFNVKGAGIVAEDGNETGQWVGNLVTGIYGDGDDASINRDEKLGDFGHSGEAYSSTARSLLQKDNIAANSTYGWKFTALQSDASYDSYASILDKFNPTPLLKTSVGTTGNFIGFHGNTAIGVSIALDSGHRRGFSLTSDVRSDIVDFTAWEVTDKAFDFFSYTADYVIKDSLLIGADSGAGSGVKLDKKSEGTSLIDVHFENFNVAIKDSGLNNLGEYVNVSFKDNNTNLRAENYGENIEGRVFNHPFRNTSGVNLNQAIAVVLDAESDLTLSPNDNKIFISGTITDSLGSYPLGENVWLSQRNGVYFIESYKLGYTNNSDKTISTNIVGNSGYTTAEELLEMHGAFQKPNGSWVMQVVFWVTDRFTATHTPIVIEVQLSGFTNSYLSQYKTTAKTPDGTLTYRDVLTGNVLDYAGNVVGNNGDGPPSYPTPPADSQGSFVVPTIMLLLDD
ncbi:G8 domain-containing protein [Arenicella xantha]|uniref:G8 domain-containing protein n=1 Tax=Arenicella xantha TaxID=644221 RepID=A0A395JTH3_9GAMM|nr:G8 domain-containing protein [Arenicella xantha]RBP52878.1 G8 domain-containing protein [Arenicella xantha]